MEIKKNWFKKIICYCLIRRKDKFVVCKISRSVLIANGRMIEERNLVDKQRIQFVKQIIRGVRGVTYTSEQKVQLQKGKRRATANRSCDY